jgi:hypothetical protein
VGRTLYSVLDRLEDRQTITKRRSVTNPRLWVYALPNFSGDTPPPSGDQQAIAEVIESVDSQPTEPIQQVFSTNSASIQHSLAETEVLKSQDVEPVGNSVGIQQPEPSVGGEGEAPLAECQIELFEQRLNGDFVAIASAQSEQVNVQEPVDDLWMTEENLQSLANDLSGCCDKEDLARLRQCWSPQVMGNRVELVRLVVTTNLFSKEVEVVEGNCE